jgi:hypothetical protein
MMKIIMAKNKTIVTQNSVAHFLTTITDKKKRNDTSAIIDLITKNTGIKPKIWGTSIIGLEVIFINMKADTNDSPLVSPGLSGPARMMEEVD